MPILSTLLLPALLAGSTTTPQILNARPNPAAKRCGPTVDKTRGPVVNGMMKLGDQPPASQVLAVYRTDADGCPKPVVLRKGIGANPEKALPVERGGTMRPVR